MTRPSLGRLTRNAEAPILLESFLVAGVASFLGIRAFLAITGYPQVGSNGIHIAHMLWGGFLMVAAVMLLLAFLDRPVEHLAAVIAGLGFGTFIDEIGKFVTSDNNYFYRPAIALIYAVFIAGFLIGRTLLGEQRRLSQTEAMANVLTLLAGTLNRPISLADRAWIEQLLGHADAAASVTRLASEYLAELPVATAHDGLVARLNRHLADAYERLMSNSWAESALIVGVVVYTAAALIGAVVVALSSLQGAPAQASIFATTAQLVSTIAGAVCIGIGVVSLPESRLAAYRWFMRGLLVWILITQVFIFYSSQLAGLGGLVVDLIAYSSLRLATALETAPRPEAARQQPRSRAGSGSGSSR